MKQTFTSALPQNTTVEQAIRAATMDQMTIVTALRSVMTPVAIHGLTSLWHRLEEKKYQMAFENAVAAKVASAMSKRTRTKRKRTVKR